MHVAELVGDVLVGCHSIIVAEDVSHECLVQVRPCCYTDLVPGIPTYHISCTTTLIINDIACFIPGGEGEKGEGRNIRRLIAINPECDYISTYTRMSIIMYM